MSLNIQATDTQVDLSREQHFYFPIMMIISILLRYRYCKILFMKRHIRRTPALVKFPRVFLLLVQFN
jgi:hypothetical protein